MKKLICLLLAFLLGLTALNTSALAAITVSNPELLPWAHADANATSINENIYQITNTYATTTVMQRVTDGVTSPYEVPVTTRVIDRANAKLISLGTEFKKMSSLSIAAVNGYVVFYQDGENKAALLETILGKALNGSAAKTITFGENCRVFKADAFSGTNVEKINFISASKISLSSNAFRGYSKTKLGKIKLTFNAKAYPTAKEQEELITKLTARGFKKCNISFRIFSTYSGN